MGPETYLFDYDKLKNLCQVHVNGELNPEKIRHTYLKIFIKFGHAATHFNILYILKKVSIPKDLGYAKILKNAEEVTHILPKGKSAAVLEDDSTTLRQLAEFYGSLATAHTIRGFKLFDSIDKAVNWIEYGEQKIAS